MGHHKTGDRPDADATRQPTPELDSWNATVPSVATASAVDYRVPGRAPDPTALVPWVDAPAKPSPQDLAVDMQATAHAAALMLVRDTTNDPSARWRFLNTLDRIDDPVLRAKTLQKFQAQIGMPLPVFIKHTEWHSDRDEKQALALISPERGAAERELQAMSPENRKKLSADANGWSQQVLHVSRPGDANDNSAKVADVLGKRSPVEIEAIRASVRHSTRDKSLYQEIDRSLSGGDEDEALAGTTGSPVFAASIGIANAEGDAERVKKIVSGLSKEQRAGLVLSNGPLGASAITSTVHESQRGEIQEILTGTDATADGARFANLFKDPKAGLEFDGMQPTEQSQQSFNARQPENVLKELRSKSPEQIAKARIAWDTANPNQSWDRMIQERFGQGDPTTFLRITALAHGDRIEERAYALRDGIRKNNQAQIEAALANPDLSSKDPAKQAAAQAEKRLLEARVRELDALGQRATAMMMGQDPAHAAGRDLDTQLADHYTDAIAKTPHTTDAGDLLLLSVDPDGQRAKRTARASDDTYATNELTTQGSLSTTTQIRRAETKGDTQRKAELLENLDSGSELATVRAEYERRHDKDVLANPDLADIDTNTEFLQSTWGRSSEDTRDIVADKMQSSNELKIENVRRYGVKAERSPFLQYVLQKGVFRKQRSESLKETEELRARYGLNIGTDDYAEAQLANQSDQFTTPTGPYGTGIRELKAGISAEDVTQQDDNVAGAFDVHRAEKIKHADQMANTFVTAAKLAALFAGQPGLVLLIDAAANLGGMAIKQSAGGSDVDVSKDMQMMAVDLFADAVPVVGRLGGAADVGASAARVGERTTAELGEHAVIGEAKSEAVGAGAKAAAGESLSKELAVEGGAAQLAKGDTAALALADGKLANEGVSAGTTAASHGGLVTNLTANAFGSVAGSVVQGESSNDNLTAGVRALLGMFLPSHFAGSMQKAIGTGTKLQRGFGSLIGTGADIGTNAAISGSVLDAATSRIGHHVGGHPSSHADDARFTPTRRRDDDPNPLAHYADEPDQHPARQIDGPEGSSSAPNHAANAADRDAAIHVARVQRPLSPAQRAATEEHMGRHGHPGSEVHSHFLGIASTDDFKKQMGGPGKPLTNEEMLARMHSAVREDKDYAKHYSRDDQGNQVFGSSGAGKHHKGGHAFENVKAIETAQVDIENLRKLPASAETEALIQQKAETAVRAAMETTQGTPFDGAYSIRDTLVKAYIDAPNLDGTVRPYENYMKMALAALERDGVHYSEQSQSVNKLRKTEKKDPSFPEQLTKDGLAEINAERAKRGEPPMDVRFLAMLETRFLGEQGSDSAGTATDWKEQLDAAREVMRRGDVLGLDFASPETTTMAKGGDQLNQRFREAATMLKEVGAERGRKLVLRPHVGEGYVEMPIDPQTGKPMDHDRDHNREHYQKARDNMRALVNAVDAMSKPGPNGEAPLYDPKNPAFEIRFGHSTHASPEIAADMARLGIVAEVNLGSNAISGSLQDNPNKPAGRDPDGRLQSFEDHALLTLSGNGVPIELSTDGPAVMNTTLREEYDKARDILEKFRGNSAEGEKARGTMPVTRDAYLAAHPGLDQASVQPPFMLGYHELPEEMKQNIDTAFERMVADAAARSRDVADGDRNDLARKGESQ